MPAAAKGNRGQGLGKVGMAVCYEEMNRSIFGPVVFNSAAPDDGNMMVLEQAGTDAQKERWLKPIAEGKVRSSFAMTEPHPGAGSDPNMMLTTAEKRGDTYVLRGRKWFITGAENASHFITIARTSDDPRHGLTAFLHHRDEPGWRIERRIPIMGPEEHGGHCEIVYEDMVLPADRVLLGEGKGLKITQMRLGPARLTHCMRWLGLAKRCTEIARTYACEREGFGIRLANRESTQIKLGDLAMGIEIGRLLVMKAAWTLDQGDFAKKKSPWRKFTSPTSFTRPPTPQSRSMEHAAIPRTRSLNGFTATRAKQGSSMVRMKSTRWFSIACRLKAARRSGRGR